MLPKLKGDSQGTFWKKATIEEEALIHRSRTTIIRSCRQLSSLKSYKSTETILTDKSILVWDQTNIKLLHLQWLLQISPNTKISNKRNFVQRCSAVYFCQWQTLDDYLKHFEKQSSTPVFVKRMSVPQFFLHEQIYLKNIKKRSLSKSLKFLRSLQA